jgi:hypothetical protein
MKNIILAVCLFLLVGCSYNPNSVQVEIDSSFSQDKRELIIQALADWNAKTNGGFGVSTVSYVDGLSPNTEDNVIKFVNQDVEEDEAPDKNLTIVGLTNTNYSTLGHPTDHVQATILIWNEEPDTTFAPAVTHELGHAFNLGHYCTEAQSTSGYFSCEVVSSDPEPTIMYPVLTSGINEVQPIDVYRFCQLWNCPE